MTQSSFLLCLLSLFIFASVVVISKIVEININFHEEAIPKKIQVPSLRHDRPANLVIEEDTLLLSKGDNRTTDYSWAETEFRNTGLNMSASDLKNLPTNEEIKNLLGEKSIMVNKDSKQCLNFQNQVPKEKRWIGVSGLFNTGTNLLYKLLEMNCELPDSKLGKPVRWQVPWGKHSYAHTSRNHTAPYYEHLNKDDGLAIVIVRDPFTWSLSMCKNPYIVKWKYTEENCPNLRESVPTWGPHKNLLYFYNDWYKKYTKQFPYPHVIIRLEDLTIRPKQTIENICECGGGRMRSDFQYMTGSAKSGVGHKSTTGMEKAWQQVMKKEKYRGFSPQDYEIARESLDMDLMNMFGYQID